MSEEMYNGFIKTTGVSKVIKNKPIKGNTISFIEDNAEQVNNIIENGKVIVRKNHVRKVTFKILTLNVDTKLDKDLYIAVSMEMHKRYKGNYLPKYGGWIIEELPYEPDRTKSMKEMQEEFLARNTVTREDSEINYLSKDLKTYKSKSYINTTKDYKQTITEMVHVYNNLRFMTPDGSMDVLFRFKRLVAESGDRYAYQTIYYVTQTNNKNDKSKTSSINEINIPKFLEDYKMVPYIYETCAAYYKNYSNIKYRSKEPKTSSKSTNVNGNKFTIDEEWYNDFFDRHL